MANVVVVGSQWGDEGKGKIVDWLSEQADVVVRFQGGHNAGHTLVIDGVDLQAVAAAVRRGAARQAVGDRQRRGARSARAARGDRPARRRRASRSRRTICASPRTSTLILPLHQELDALRESSNAGTRIGTTKRGIGPAYEDKVGRRAIRLMDLADLGSLGDKIDGLLAHHNALRRGNGLDEIEAQDDLRRARRGRAEGAALHGHGLVAARRQAPRGQAHPVRRRAGRAARRRPRHLSVRHLVEHGRRRRRRPARASGPGAIGYVLGICKAYTTRVGEGPFPTEQHNEIGRRIGERGREFGTVTGRPRRCGWFDAVLVRQTVRTSGINGLALTKLDILDGFDEIKVCVGYRLDGREIDYLPASASAQARVEPVYETVEGWKSATAGARSWAELPAQAIKYVRRIEELVDCPVALLSTSPEREDTILVQNPFET